MSEPAPRRAPLVLLALFVAGVALTAILRLSGERLEHAPAAAAPAEPEGGAGSAPPPAALAAARVELPGMSLEAPSRPAVLGDYRTGSVQATAPLEWGVTWQPGALPPEAPLAKIVDAMASAMGAQLGAAVRRTGGREVTIDGAPGRRFELASDRGDTIAATFTVCGGRVVQLLARWRTDEQRALAERLATSFRCAPEAAAPLNGELVAYEVRPGWKRTSATGRLSLVDERDVFVNAQSVPAVAGTPLETYLPPAIRSVGITLDSDRPETRAGRKVWRGTAGTAGAIHAAVVAWPCPGGGQIAAVYIFSRSAPVDAGIDLALGARCLAAGEKLPDYPVKAP